MAYRFNRHRLLRRVCKKYKIYPRSLSPHAKHLKRIRELTGLTFRKLIEAREILKRSSITSEECLANHATDSFRYMAKAQQLEGSKIHEIHRNI